MTIFNEIERDAKNGTPDNWGYKPCQCGHPNCDQNTMDNQGSVGFHLDDARRIANVPRYERAIMAAKELADKAEDVDRVNSKNDDLDVALAAFREATK